MRRVGRGPCVSALFESRDVLRVRPARGDVEAIGGDERLETLLHSLLLPSLVLLALERVLVRRDDRLEDRLLEEGAKVGRRGIAPRIARIARELRARSRIARACSNGFDESE